MAAPRASPPRPAASRLRAILYTGLRFALQLHAVLHAARSFICVLNFKTTLVMVTLRGMTDRYTSALQHAATPSSTAVPYPSAVAACTHSQQDNNAVCP